MKILLVSDIETSYIWDHFDPERFNDIELIISCGDLKAEYMSFLVTMIGVPLLYVHGNHDEDYINNPPEGCDCIDDKLIKYKNLRIIGFGGSRRYNKGKFQYTDFEMKMRTNKAKPSIFMNKGIDILVTHAGGLGIGDDIDECHKGFKSFNDLLDKHSPKYFLHGHTHLSYGMQERIIKYKSTTVVNAYGYYILNYEL